jgi:hypothetical protein
MIDQPADYSEQLDDELRALLDGVVTGSLDADEIRLLNQRLSDEPEKQLPALMYLDLHACLQRQWRGMGTMTSNDSTNALYGLYVEEREWAALAQAAAEEEQTLPVLRPPAQPEAPSHMAAIAAAVMRLGQRFAHYLQRDWLNRPRRGWAEGVIGLATVALIVMLLLLPQPGDMPEATVVEAIHVTWAADSTLPDQGQMNPGQYRLTSGLINIRTANGVEINLEGPCDFNLISEESLRLNSGTLYAEARGPQPEFAVLTPTALVKDLGTAFGVAVAADGSTETVVFEGVVSFSTPRARDSKPMLIPETFSSRVSADKGTIEPLRQVSGIHEYLRYPQQITQRVWLANLICEPESGDVSDCHCGINLDTGQRVLWANRLNSPIEEAHLRMVSPGYHGVPEIAAVDGVFVPSEGPGVVLDSTGSTFDGFPPFAPHSYGDLWVGRPFPEREIHARRAGVGPHALLMHAPKGITLDLHRVAAREGGRRPLRFRAALLNCAERGADAHSDLSIDFWVFVDGQLVFTRDELTYRDGFQQIDIALPPGARYLTLVSTVGADGLAQRDYAMLDNAMIELGE